MSSNPNQDLPLLPAPLPTEAPPNTGNSTVLVLPPQSTNNDSTNKKRKRDVEPKNNHDPPRFATGGITLPSESQLPPANKDYSVGGKTVEKTVLPPPPPVHNNKMVQSIPPRDTIPIVWQCHKCKNENKISKSRCGNCQAWRGGKREPYATKKQRGMQQIDLKLMWTCPCGSQNKGKKVRCSKCQKWRGGRRFNKNNGAIETQLFAYQRQQATLMKKSNESAKAWNCDKCGHENAADKVRCNNCPRWKDGKRAKFSNKKKAKKKDINLEGPLYDIFPAEETMDTQQQQEMTSDGGGWLCSVCAHVNGEKKARCGSCQRWKFGKRDNILKINRPDCINPTIDERTAGGVAGLNGTEIDTQDRTMNWSCSCGEINLATKVRCSSCQKWKGGKRGPLQRKEKSSIKQIETEIIALPTIQGGMPVVPILEVPRNKIGEPWTCTRCGNDNGHKSLRCLMCQSFKNGKKQLEAVGGMSQAAFIQAHKQPGASFNDGVLYSPPWKCHNPRCGAIVDGSKSRCSHCNSWKGGTRENTGRSKRDTTQPWACHSCNTENAASTPRCIQCQSWRFGGANDLRTSGDWVCDKCKKPNQHLKVRCGGCHRWRDGKRPEFDKAAKTHRVKVPAANVIQLKSPVQAQPVIKVYPQHRMLTLPKVSTQNPTSTSRQVPVAQVAVAANNMGKSDLMHS